MPPRSLSASAVSLAAIAAASLLTPSAWAAPTRAYELVSFPDAGARGVSVGTSSDAPLDDRRNTPSVAASGERVLFSSAVPVPGQQSSGASQVWAAQRTAGGWTQAYVGLPARRAALDVEQAPRGFSTDFQTSLWQALGTVGFDPIDPSQLPATFDPASTFRSYFSALYRTPSGTSEQLRGPEPRGDQLPTNMALSRDGSIVTFALPAGTSLLTGDLPNGGSIYQRRAGGDLQLVSRDEQGAPVSANPLATSVDGERVLYVDADAPERLYLRKGTSSTVPIDLVPPSPLYGSLAVLEAATPDLHTLFISTTARLASTDIDDAPDLYRYDAQSGAMDLVSAGTAGASAETCATPLPVGRFFVSGLDCEALVAATSADGATTYFISPEALPGTTGGEDGASNVYRYDAATKATTFIAKLATDDPLSAPSERLFRTAGDGSLLFLSKAPLAGTDPAGFAQLYRADAKTGAITCLSCRVGKPSTAEASLGRPFARITSVPGRNDTDGGRYVYFDSAERLESGDTNAVTDVYEVDTQTGERTLITPGSAATPSVFLGVGDARRDVFFGTTEPLVAGDRNGTTPRIYDARVGGGFPEPTPPEACSSDSCRPAPPSPPVPGAVGSDQPPSVDDGPVAAEPEVEVLPPTAAERRAIPKTGRLRIRLKGLDPGGRYRITFRVEYGSKSVRLGTADRTPSTAQATATVSLSRGARAELVRRLRVKSRDAELEVERLDAPDATDLAVRLVKTKGRS